MCVYCFIADWAHKWVPDQPSPWSPWQPPFQPWMPAPPGPVIPSETPVEPPVPVTYKPWTREQLEEFEEILRLVREMEDALGGCPCEDASKMDYLREIRARLDRQKEQIDAEKPDEPDAYVDG